MAEIAIALFSMFAWQGCGATHPTGGPHYYGSWGSYFVPIVPTSPLSQAEAQARPLYCEAFFDGEGRIIKFIKYANRRVESETSYSYRPDKSFEERICYAGTLVVTVYDKEGTERSSKRTNNGC